MKPLTFNEWWYEIGSGIGPRPQDDMESHAGRVARLAWMAAQEFGADPLKTEEELSAEAMANAIRFYIDAADDGDSISLVEASDMLEKAREEWLKATAKKAKP